MSKKTKPYYVRFKTLFHKFRFYDCGEIGYRILADGKDIGIAYSLMEAEEKARKYVDLSVWG